MTRKPPKVRSKAQEELAEVLARVRARHPDATFEERRDIAAQLMAEVLSELSNEMPEE
ncbi:MAG: hypothetical protein H0W68_05765 [Gemmatimonadaceae bacterium]|nr:hypothetical protein [Gemmatimonadaceae bacterium]